MFLVLVEPSPVWSAPARAVQGPLMERVRADVVVVGGGPAGLSAALALAERKVEVVLLEAGHLGEEAEALGPGLALPGLADHYGPMVAGLGREAVRSWWELGAEGVSALEAWLARFPCPFERGGLLQLAVSPTEWQEMQMGVTALTEDGFSPRMMSNAAATNLVQVDGNLGATYFPGALAFDPAAALVGLSGRLKERQGRCYENSPAVALEMDGPGVFVRTPHGGVDAEVAVLSPGFWLGKLAQNLSRFVFPLRGQSLATRPLPARIQGSTVAVTANRGHETYRSMPDGGLLAAGINPGSGYAEKTERLELDRVFQSHLERLVCQRFPEASGQEVRHRWATLYSYSADGLPLLGPLPGHIRIYVACGFGNRPWSLGVGGGRLIGRMLAGETVRFPAGSAPRRFL